MNSKVQRLQKRLEEQLASQEKHLRKAHEAAALAEQLKKEIHFEENNAIATKVREVGISFEDFDKIVAIYRENRTGSTEAAAELGTETEISPKASALTEDVHNPAIAGESGENDEIKEDFNT